MKDIEKEIIRILFNFQAACVFMASNQMRVYDQLAGKPVSAEEVAGSLNLSQKGVERLLNALAGMEIVVKEGGQYQLDPAWKKYLAKTGEQSMQQWIDLVSSHQPLWMDLPRFVKTGQNTRSVMDMLGNDPEKMESFTDAMHDKALKATWLIARELPIGDARRLLDIGGGPGTYSLEWAKLHNHLKATIFDIAPVLEIAKKYIARYGLQDRISTKPGDFLKDDLDTGYDLVLLANVLQMYDGEQAKKIVNKAVQALAPGGRIIVHGFCTDHNETGPLQDALFNIHIGLLTPGGKAHPVKDKINWLESAGIQEVRHFRVDAFPTGVITGKKGG